MRQPALYRTPRDPGYIGAYNWRAMLAGLALLLCCNIAATQYIASRFSYQPALGRPVAGVRGVSFYEPFAWADWVWHYTAAADRRVRLPILGGVAIVVLGSIATMGAFFVLNLRRTKRLSENAEDLHGSARWAVEKDIRTTGLLDAREGVYIGGWYDERAGRLVVGVELLLAHARFAGGADEGALVRGAGATDDGGECQGAGAGECGHYDFRGSRMHPCSP